MKLVKLHFLSSSISGQTTDSQNPNIRDIKGQRGIALIFVMLILVVVSILGIGGAQLAMMGERGARNERDMQIARQSAEAALVDSEFDMRGPGVAPRAAQFALEMNFLDGCGTTGIQQGLCAQTVTGKPIWLTVDFTDNSATAPTTFIGQQTTRTMLVGNGIQPMLRPRYIVEVLPDLSIGVDKGIKAKKQLLYRVTAMGFGPRADIQTVLQMVFRKD